MRAGSWLLIREAWVVPSSAYVVRVQLHAREASMVRCRLAQAGLDDGVVSEGGGRLELSVVREAPTGLGAAFKVLGQLEAVRFALRPLAIDHHALGDHVLE